MTVNKRSKNSRHRGTKTHGWGEKKKHRGSGHRGGTGNAGSGKKADCKKPRFWKDMKYFGKFGFTRQNSILTRELNLQTLETKCNLLLSKKMIEEKNGIYTVDLSRLGFDKLLSKGAVTKKWHVTCKQITENAKTKIEAAGGAIILNQSQNQVEDKVEKVK